MKKLFAIIAFVAISINAFSQITNLYVTKDSTVIIDKLYAGILAGG